MAIPSTAGNWSTGASLAHVGLQVHGGLGSCRWQGGLLSCLQEWGQLGRREGTCRPVHLRVPLDTISGYLESWPSKVLGRDGADNLVLVLFARVFRCLELLSTNMTESTESMQLYICIFFKS